MGGGGSAGGRGGVKGEGRSRSGQRWGTPSSEHHKPCVGEYQEDIQQLEQLCPGHPHLPCELLPEK